MGKAEQKPVKKPGRSGKPARVSLPPRGEMRIEWIALHEVRRWPRNPKDHDLPAIQASFARFGWVEPVVLDEGTGQLVAGHGRLEAAHALQQSGAKAPDRTKLGPGGTWLVPVLRGVAFESENEAEAYLLASNQLVVAGGWHEKELAGQLRRLEGSGTEVKALGWSEDELRKLYAKLNEPPPPGEFPQFGADLETKHTCPKCGYEFS